MRSNLSLVETLPAQSADAAPAFGRPDLKVIPGLLGEQTAPCIATETPHNILISANAIPELAEERQQAAQTAARILGNNKHRLQTAETDEVLTPVDALGTARQVVEIKRLHGVDSPKYQEVFTGLVLDSERLLAEAFRKNTSEYFARSQQDFDPAAGEHFSHGLSIPRMATNALIPTGESEEDGRRVNEFVEEVGTYAPLARMIGRVGLQAVMTQVAHSQETVSPVAEQGLTSLHVTTISECPDYTIRDYQINPKASHGGYVPAVEKLMIRRVHFNDDSGDRQEEQVAVPGMYITHDLISQVLTEERGIAQPEQLDKTELHSTQFIGVDGQGVMSLVEKLDRRASEIHGKHIFMGEEVPTDHPRDYAEFEQEAEIRRRKLAPKPTELANHLIMLEENGTDSRIAEALVNKFLRETLLSVAKKHPELAEAMFDSETAEGFAEVARLEASGQYEAAQRLEYSVKEKAPEVSYCGAGGCAELDSVDPTSPAGQLAMRLGLRGRMVRNKDAACKNCRAKELYHDYNGSTVCVACKSTKLSGQGVKKGNDKGSGSGERKTGRQNVTSLSEKRQSGKKKPDSGPTSEEQPSPEKPGKILPFRPRQEPKGPSSAA